MAPEDGLRTTYLAALRLLARRELSAYRVRQRLVRKQHPAEHIDAAIARLREERAIDDVRVAEAIARTATMKRRGKLRVRREIENAGIAPEVARAAVEGVFAGLDDEDLLDSALRRRLPDDRTIADDREYRRLYRFLALQGFESDRIVRALERRRGRLAAAPDQD